MIEKSILVWRRSRGVSLLSLAVLIVFGGLFWWMIASGAPATRRLPHEYALFIGWAGLVLCFLVGGLGILELLNPTRLIVLPEGFEQRGLWRKSVVPWSDVSAFVIWRQESSNSVPNLFAMSHLGYLLTAEARGKQKRRWRRWIAFGHYDGWLMSGTGDRAQKIADLLEGRRRAAREDEAARLSPG